MSTNTDVANIIDSNNKKLCAGLTAGDAAAIAALYANGATLLPPNSPPIGNDGLATFWQGAIDMGIRGGELKSTSVEVHRDTAIELGAYTLRAADGSALDNGSYIVIWKNEGGDWMLYQDIFNTDQPAS